MSNKKIKDETKEAEAKVQSSKSKVETTKELAKRLHQEIQYVYHEVDWSSVMYEKTKWKFEPKKNYLNKNLFGQPNQDVFTLDIMSPESCKKLIELTEERGYEDCGYPKHYRSNTRLITEDKKLAELLYKNISRVMPKEYKMINPRTKINEIWEIYGLNPRFRWCKYIKGQLFAMHCDAQYRKDYTDMSLYTVNIYLNNGKEYSGKKNQGKTRFFDSRQDKKPKFVANAIAGRALVFNHYPEHYLHDGELVENGLKYLMRTDICYKLKDASNDNQ